MRTGCITCKNATPQKNMDRKAPNFKFGTARSNALIKIKSGLGRGHESTHRDGICSLLGLA